MKQVIIKDKQSQIKQKSGDIAKMYFNMAISCYLKFSS